MALIQCPECGREISDAAAACLHCGYPISEKEVHRDMTMVTEERKERAEDKNKEVTEAVKRSGLIILAVCVVLFYVLFFADMEKKRGSGTDESYDSQTEEQENRGESLTLDDIAGVIKKNLWESYDNVEVTATADTIRVKIWNDGVAAGIYFIQQGELERDEWDDIKRSIINLSRNIQEVMKAGGRSDVHLSIDVLNDQNTEKTLLTVFDSTVVFDILSE